MNLRTQGLTALDLSSDFLPVERAIGVQWAVESDTPWFGIILKDKPLTRRGILSTICSIYDPLGIAAPFSLTGKKILQDLCRAKSGMIRLTTSFAYIGRIGEVSCLHWSTSQWTIVSSLMVSVLSFQCKSTTSQTQVPLVMAK